MSVRTRVRRLLGRDSPCCPECGTNLPTRTTYRCEVCGYDLIRRVRDSQPRQPMM